MDKTERFTTAQLISKEYLCATSESQDLVDYVMRDMAEKIASELTNRLEYGEKIVRLGNYKVSDFNYTNSVEYRREVFVTDIVRCKDCKYSYIEADGRRCCSTVLEDRSTTDDWFCKDGERKDDEHTD